MALRLRLRRAAALSSSLLKGRGLSAAVSSASAPPLSSSSAAANYPLLARTTLRPHSLSQALFFRSSAPLSDRRNHDGEEKKFGPDDILFEGCDYNHWLITMDFPKDPAPTREEMIETYIQTLAKVVGSVEEAKKRMYALSTTTYQGFQAVMTEEMSEKFHGLPGVVFVLPDSYIDPVNKEYGGDKYENGVITPRPPPIQYGRQGRPRNQYRNDRPNYNQPPPQGNTSFGQQDFRQSDARNYAPPQTQPGQDGRGYGPPGGPPQGNTSFGQQEFRQSDARNYAPPQTQPGQDGRGYGPPGGRDFVHSGERRDNGQGEQRNYSQPGGRYPYQGEQRDPMPSYQQDFNQGGRGNFIPQDQRNFSQGSGGDSRFNGPSGYGDDRQRHNPGYTGDYRQGMGPGYGGRQDVNSGYHGEYKQGPGYGGNHRQESPPAPVDGPAGSWQGRT